MEFAHMAGVREKKKQRTQNQILDAAIDLFAEKGYAGATIEDIAGLAVVGVGTVYNYFSSKRGLLLALLARETVSLVETGSELIEKPGNSPEDAISDLLWIYTNGWIKFDRKLMREFMVAAFTEPDSLGKELYKLDYVLIGQIGSLIQKFQERGIFRKDLPYVKIAMIIYSIWGTILLIYIEGFLEKDKLKEEIRFSIDLAFKSWKVQE